MRRRKKREPEEEQHEAETGQQAVEVVVPIDPVNEQVVLAAMAIDVVTRNDLVKRLPPDTFLVEQHRVLVAGMRELVNRNLDYDPATLQRIVGDKADVGYLGQITDVRPDVPANLDFHVRALLWDRQRALAVTGPIAALIEAVRDPRAAPERVRALADHVAGAFEKGHGTSWLVTPDEVRAALDAMVDKAHEGPGIYPYGIDALDFYDDGRPRMIPGSKPGKVTVVTGISGGGKTTLAAHLMLGMARQKRRGLYCAWEVLPEEMLALMTTISLAEEDLERDEDERYGWSRTTVLTGKDSERNAFFTPERRRIFDERRHAISEAVRFMRNPFRKRARGSKVTNDDNLDLLMQHVQDAGADFFVADLWLRSLRYKGDDDVEEALWKQQALAEEMGVHAFLLHQQRLKDVEMRPDKRPTREGLKGTSAWVDIADTILAPHIPSLFKRVPDDVWELLILKQRYGKWPLGLSFEYDADRGTLREGREVPYDPPGESSGVDDFVPPMPSQGKRKRRGQW